MLSGILTVVILVQSLNAERPIFITLSGIFMFVSFVHPLKAQFPIVVTPVGEEKLPPAE